MASKQLGKLKQWAGEVISSRDKTVVSDEFRELEQDIELRRQGLWRLHVASDDYLHILKKKKESEAIEENDKLLPIDTFGIVMIRHGEEFGEDSAFGTSLVSMGRAHCKIATLQETFSMTFEDTFLASIHLMEDEIKEYQAQRKKLEGRRMSYDAAISKMEKVKGSKKVKEAERKEAEEELDNAKVRYEEAVEDIRARMCIIQENEITQLRDLTSFLDLEINFVEQYLEALREAKSGCADEATVRRIEIIRPTVPKQMFTRPGIARTGSVRSTKSPSKRLSHNESSGEGSSADEKEVTRRSRGLSFTRRKSEASNKAPSRPPSRAPSHSRKRADSEVPSDKEPAEKAEKSFGIVSGLASVATSAVNSVTGRSKKDHKDRDKDNFAALRDDRSSSGDDSDEGERSRPPSAQSSSSRKSQKSKSSPSIPNAVPKASRTKTPFGAFQGKETQKVVVALHDFAAASTDELSFRAGDKIAVVNEVLDGWWMGELNGKRGLFPTTYTETISSSSSLSSAPSIPLRPPALYRGPALTAPPVLSVNSKESRHKLLDASDSGDSGSEEDHPFGDHYLAASQTPTEAQFGFTTQGEDDEEQLLVSRPPVDEDRTPSGRQTPVRRAVEPPTTIQSPTKKPPPPPPPPRRVAALTPPLLPSRPSILRTKSSQSSSISLGSSTAPEVNADGLTHSPFDSPGDSW